jgi:hypothetical protein
VHTQHQPLFNLLCLEEVYLTPYTILRILSSYYITHTSIHTLKREIYCFCIVRWLSWLPVSIVASRIGRSKPHAHLVTVYMYIMYISNIVYLIKLTCALFVMFLLNIVNILTCIFTTYSVIYKSYVMHTFARTICLQVLPHEWNISSSSMYL